MTIHSNGISLETTAYTEFNDFFNNLCEVMRESKKLIDSDFFTRVGFRYVNTIPIEDGEIDGWLNPSLIATTIQKPFGSIAKYSSEIRGYTEVGDYTLRHGIKSIEDHEIKEYFLDFDYFSEDVEYDNATSLIEKFNTINFSFFDWCLGSKAKKLLGEGKKKGKIIMANYASSITEISKQNNYLYPDFSNTGYFKTFEPRQQKARPHLRLVDEGSTEISRALASTTSTFDDSTSLDGIDIDGTKGDKIATNQKPDYSETTNRDRVTLLAKKYAQKYFSKEDEARLAIVTERIRLLMPRVTMDDFEQLAEIAGEIKRINELDNKLRNELGL